MVLITPLFPHNYQIITLINLLLRSLCSIYRSAFLIAYVTLKHIWGSVMWSRRRPGNGSYRFMCNLFRKRDEWQGSCLLCLNSRYAHVKQWEVWYVKKYEDDAILPSASSTLKYDSGTSFITHEAFLVFPFLWSITGDSEFFLRKLVCWCLAICPFHNSWWIVHSSACSVLNLSSKCSSDSMLGLAHKKMYMWNWCLQYLPVIMTDWHDM